MVVSVCVAVDWWEDGKAIASASHAGDAVGHEQRTVDGVAAAALRAAPVLADLHFAVQGAVTGSTGGVKGRSAKHRMRNQEAISVKGRDALVRVDGEASASDDALSVEREDLDRVLWRSHVWDL